MFAYLEGTIAYKKADHFALDVNGLGFAIRCSSAMLARIPAQGERARIYTYMAVREDNVSIYGFPTLEEHAMFVMLLTVSGVGPKLAAAIAGTLEPSAFALAVISSDIALLSSVKGLGRKGAEKIVVELKDKIKGIRFDGSKAPAAPGELPEPAAGAKFAEACTAMTVLGYTPAEAHRAVSAAYAPDAPLEVIIKSALRELLQ